MIFPPIIDPPEYTSLKSKVAQRLLRQVIQRDGMGCHWCGKETIRAPRWTAHSADNHATLDHIVDRADGGQDILENCVVGCFRCNQRRNGESHFIRSIATSHRVAPNRLFGARIRDGCAV